MRATELTSRFFAWWVDELRGCVPGMLRRAFTPVAPRLALCFGDDQLDIIYERRRDSARTVLTLPRSHDLAIRVQDCIAKFVPRGNVPIGLRIPLGWCLERQLEIPYGARASASSIEHRAQRSAAGNSISE